ncbi:MAG: hypothetical protein K2X87_19455 [Gemmataceae bacterium]|nr:hypothetical protein [Gemmataceae bacterium]
MPVTPSVRGLYLCERVELGPGTRNLTPRNCFRALRIAGLPTRAKPFTVVAYLANGIGQFPVAVVVRRLDTLGEVYAARAMLTFADRLAEVRLTIRVEQCVFPAAGEYEVALWVGHELLAQTPFTVKHLETTT